MFEDMEQKKITIPEGWEIDKVEGNEIILKESEKELPKTWFECLCKYKENMEFINPCSKIISITQQDIDGNSPNSDKKLLPKGLGKPMLALMQLLVCRDVYRQGWKPSLGDVSIKYVIYNCCNKIEKGEGSRTNYILSFKLEEVRNKFLENFRDLIEEAKELI